MNKDDLEYTRKLRRKRIKRRSYFSMRVRGYEKAISGLPTLKRREGGCDNGVFQSSPCLQFSSSLALRFHSFTVEKISFQMPVTRFWLSGAKQLM